MISIPRPHSVWPAPSGAGPRAVAFRLSLAVAVTAGLGGCYSYTPLASAPEPGVRVALDLNDRGRAALEQHVGPEVRTVEGVVREATDSTYLLSMVETRDLSGGQTRWAGESVVISPTHVRTARERRYSQGRTVALGVALASAAVVFMTSRNLLGGGSGGDDGNPPPPPPAGN
jgi:hypothetical protein